MAHQAATTTTLFTGGAGNVICRVLCVRRSGGNGPKDSRRLNMGHAVTWVAVASRASRPPPGRRSDGSGSAARFQCDRATAVCAHRATVVDATCVCVPSKQAIISVL